MDHAELNAIFWQAVKAWEQRDLTGHSSLRILLHNASSRGTHKRTAMRLHHLLADYVCACPSEVIPFAAYAMQRACKALKGLDVDFTRIAREQAIDTVHRVGVNLMTLGERGAAIDSAIKLEGMRDAYHGLDSRLHQKASDAQMDLLQRVQQLDTTVSHAFQAHPSTENLTLTCLEVFSQP
ncbi:hypothetical protein [Marinobacter sp. JSM 1782161]|uniref:hypothetical protein n=1 Tax=Marinobacter sp. JSM 1782161 TaxID=2685906 RepID=UPI0014031835|nr:hypothetical protein [Marinobacter sp. JSM 1782161]